MGGDAKTRLFTTLSTVLEALPEPLAVEVAAAVGALIARRSTPTRRLVASHVERVLADNPAGLRPDPALVDRVVRRTYAAYARYWAEGATLPGTERAAISSRMLIAEGEPELRVALASGRGAIVALPHVGSWEWGGAYLARIGLPMTAVAERLEPEELFEFFLAKRRAMGLGIVPLSPSAGSALTAHLGAGGLVGLLCDRDLSGDGRPAELFGAPTTVPAGPATLALRTGAALFYAAVYSGPGREHVAIIKGPLDTSRRDGLRRDVARVTAEVTAGLESLIRRAPEQWHVFQPLWLDERGEAG